MIGEHLRIASLVKLLFFISTVSVSMWVTIDVQCNDRYMICFCTFRSREASIATNIVIVIVSLIL
jgi:hypothetical protein